MACSNCGTKGGCGSTGGCGGGCATGGCNRLNTYDWLTQLDIQDSQPLGIVEVSFKQGARKGFYRTDPSLHITTGDPVAVEAGNGYDVGQVTLSGDLVRLQMKKKRVTDRHVMHHIIRYAHSRDLERLAEARSQEKYTMVRARAIVHTLRLDMKIGDVEYQGDRRKATFYYTAKGRIDFRELIRHLAKEFRIKVEMRQIGARQESARIGGIGSCGRELCCATWLTDFKSVNTSAARYQNLAINQSKLSGQCGRLKCCLNYELDAYVEAMQAFPQKADRLKTSGGNIVLVKTDIFKQMMYYTHTDGPNRGKLYPLTVAQVYDIKAGLAQGKFPPALNELAIISETTEKELDYEDVTGAVELPPEERRRKKRRNKRSSSDRPDKARDQRNDGSGRHQSPQRREHSGRQRHKQPPTTTESTGPEQQANNPAKPGSDQQPPKNRNQKRRRNQRNRNRSSDDQNK